MLGQKNRFHGHGSLKRVFMRGEAYRDRYITLKLTPNTRRQDSRYAVVVSRKIHKSAVLRNRVRRRVYEVLRHQLGEQLGVYDVVIIVTSGELVSLPPHDLYLSILKLGREAGLYK